MADLESFFGFESTQGAMSPEAFEAFKELMRQNAQQIQAIRKAEKKQKKKEDKLVQILQTYIQTKAQPHILALIVQLLEANIPAAFILSILMLGNDDLQKSIGIDLNLPLLTAAKESTSENNYESELALSSVENSSTTPLNIRLAINLWARNIFETATLQPYRVLNTALDVENELKPPVFKLAGMVLQDYMASHEHPSRLELLEDFCKTMLNGILKKVKENTNLKELKEAEE